jgi:hypothetical protein
LPLCELGTVYEIASVHVTPKEAATVGQLFPFFLYSRYRSKSPEPDEHDRLAVTLLARVSVPIE